ncbi:hypothetical protein MMC10_006188 [Thelotrema lepadinum]|nr:hypothetical protein [Thelotrema lepadinum]
MSLYHEAASLITTSSSISHDSLKSQIFSRTVTRKSSSTQLFALVAEASKWNAILKEVVERSGILAHERRLTPALALLLTHDLLLAKKGLAIPSAHPLARAVEGHKARLQAEFTKARLRRGCATVEALRELVEREHASPSGSRPKTQENGLPPPPSPNGQAKFPQPRWLRINTLRTTLKAQLATAFSSYTQTSSLKDILSTPGPPLQKIYYLDPHIPNLIAVPRSFPLATLAAYKKGELIAQDKASCFPAYLLNPHHEDIKIEGDILDACAAPGNKTTHLAALLSSSSSTFVSSGDKGRRIFAVERDTGRAKTLRKMLSTAGCAEKVKVFAGTDFLGIKPEQEPWCGVGMVLLDPSCSGSGIVGREDGEVMGGGGKEWDMPSREAGVEEKGGGTRRKRKRKRKDIAAVGAEEEKEAVNGNGVRAEQVEEEDKVPQSGVDIEVLERRIEALSSLQTKMLVHAMRFPRARKIAYSTCSIYDKENEGVVLAALESSVAKEKGWRILRRGEQVEGMRAWNVRGRLNAFQEIDAAETIAEACIRCEKFTEQGTQGFFVAAFVRDEWPANGDETGDEVEDEWEGFDD